MSDLQVRMHGNTAVVTGAYHEKGTEKGKAYGYTVIVSPTFDEH